MADEKSNDSDTTSTGTSPLQQNEDVGGSTLVLSDIREIREMRNQRNNAMSLDQFRSPENVDGALLNMGVHSSMIQHTTELSGPAQSMPGWTLTMNNQLVSGFGGSMDAGFAIINSNRGFPGQQFPTYQNIPVQTVGGSLYRGSIGRRSAGSRGRGRGRQPFLRRPATQSPSESARAAQRRNTIHPSAPASAQVAHCVAYPTQITPVPPQTQTTALPPLPQSVDCDLALSWPLGVPFTVQTADPPQAHTATFRPSVPQNADCHQILFTPLGVPFPVQNADPPRAQTAFYRSIPQTVGLLQPLSETRAFPLADSTKETPPLPTSKALADSTKETPPLPTSPGLDKAQPQRRSLCLICWKDLSSTTERPITTLPCGHTFHTECLLAITSAAQSDNPPSMACIGGESQN